MTDRSAAAVKAWDKRGRATHVESSPTQGAGDYLAGGEGPHLPPHMEAEATRIAGSGTEHGVAWAADGTMIERYSSGERGEVKTPSSVLAQVEGGTMMHNHPSGGILGGVGLSPADVDNAAWLRLNETVVVSKLDGGRVTYRAKGFNALSGDAGAASLVGEKVAATLKAEHAAADSIISRAFSRGLWGDNPSQQFGNAVKAHLAMKRTAQQHGIHYEARWRGSLGGSRVGSLDDALGMLTQYDITGRRA